MKNIRRFVMLLIVFLSLFSFTSCVDLNCETCGDVQNSEVIRLTKKNAISTNKSYTVKAIVTPSYAIDTLSWKLEYVDGSSSTNISNYVSMSISSDTKSCTLTKKMTSKKQMKLTCYISNKTSVKATCTIDFLDTYFYFQNDCFSVDFSNIVANNMPLAYAFVQNLDITNPSYYVTSGGTKRLTVKNITIVEGFLDSDYEYGYFEEQDFFQWGICDMFEDYGFNFEDCTAYITISADLYYGNTLIYKSLQSGIEFYPINCS